MKTRLVLCVVISLVIGISSAVQAGWHGGGWGGGHGGGCWGGHGGGWYGGVFVAPGYYAPYPYYYGGPAYYPTYYSGGSAGSASSESLAVSVQRVLANEGYYHGPIDGIVGSGTRGAIAAYQRDHDLDATGSIDGALLRSMRL